MPKIDTRSLTTAVKRDIPKKAKPRAPAVPTHAEATMNIIMSTFASSNRPGELSANAGEELRTNYSRKASRSVQ
jgi:hypothetical protein